MAWVLLPVNYTDAVWSGLKRYMQVNNEDGTVSFQDVTVYSQKDNSFFGARDANRMNEALNTIMSMVENGTDLYTAFQNYFTAQQQLFERTADQKQTEFSAYLENIEEQGDALIEELETDYREEITQFENTQEQVFNTWFQLIKDQLSGDIAGNLQNQITILEERLALMEHMVLENDFSAPIATDDETLTLIVDDNGYAILADWKHKEV